MDWVLYVGFIAFDNAIDHTLLISQKRLPCGTNNQQKALA
jgi:hypothetical protein